MHNEEVIGLMKGTIPFTNKTLSRLSDVIKDYPYFQTAHLLHTLNLLHIKDPHLLFDLRKTAVYAPDRKQLFFRVEDDLFDPKLIEALEKDTQPLDSPFELIDIFLSGSAEKVGLKAIKPDSSLVSTDYVSYYLSEKMETKETPPLHHQDKIDKFLENDAKSPVRIKLAPIDESEKEFPEPIAEEPIEGAGFFSELLAKIYIKQKKYTKALEIIRELNLIYPEKSSYFAAQIEFIERLIIYTKKIK